MASHQALLHLLNRPDALLPALESQAKAARQASRLMHAHSSLLQLQLTLQKSASRFPSRPRYNNLQTSVLGKPQSGTPMLYSLLGLGRTFCITLCMLLMKVGHHGMSLTYQGSVCRTVSVYVTTLPDAALSTS